MNRLLLLLLVFVLPASLSAQKKELSQARSILKSGNGLANGQQILEKLLADPENRKEEKIWITLYQTLVKRYDEGNEKLYLKQNYDTALLFNLTAQMATTLFALDSLDATPDAGGKVKLKYRKKYADELLAYRPNIFFGGSYYTRKGDFKQGFRFFDLYVNSASQPLFSVYRLAVTDSVQYRQAAYCATYCAYKLKDADKTLQYAPEALQNGGDLYCSTLQYMANAYQWKKDSVNYLNILKRGFHSCRRSLFFFPRIVDYFTEKNQLDSALVFTNEALKADSTHLLYLFAKSTLLLNMGDNDGSYAVSEKIIALNDTLAEPYYNAGTAFINKASKQEETAAGRADKLTLRRYYENARPYFERYRQLAPDQQDKWVPSLYRIYLNLNMGRQFEEMDALMKQH